MKKAAIAVGASLALFMVVVMSSPLGILLIGGEDQSLLDLTRQITNDFNSQIETIKAENPHDELEVNQQLNWQEILAVYTARAGLGTAADGNLLRSIFQDMVHLTFCTEAIETAALPEVEMQDTETEETAAETGVRLIITISQESLAYMSALYTFTPEQVSILETYLRPDNTEIWNWILLGIPAVAPNLDGWVTPLEYYTITSRFGYRRHPIYGDYRMHNGLDMAAPAGTPIYAARDGIVFAADYNDVSGNHVRIDHGDGYITEYMHMTYYIVHPGQPVSAGQVIGYVGSTGNSTGPHLHYNVKFNGEYIDPESIIAAA